MRTTVFFLFLFFVFYSTSFLKAQAEFANNLGIFNLDTCYEEVSFFNPSFEDSPWLEKVPAQWDFCESTPDVHPFFSGATFPSDGISYVGIGASVLQGYKESFGQLLVDTLQKGTKYGFLLDVARSNVWGGVGDISIWLGDTLCQKDQLIYTTVTYDTLWHTHFIEFVPDSNYLYISFAATFRDSNYTLIDNLRPIPTPIGCTVKDTSLIFPDKGLSVGIYTDIKTIEAGGFRIYPNPNVQGFLMIEWGESLSVEEIVLINTLGSEVRQYEVLPNEISQQLDIRALSSGYYLVLLQGEGKGVLRREKLIVSKP